MTDSYNHLADQLARDIEYLQQQIENLPNDEAEKSPIKLLEKIGYNVLDITSEITILRQIKIMRTELEIMEKVFTDQTEVLEAMDDIIRTMEEPDQKQSLPLRTVFRQSSVVKELIQHAKNPDLTVRTFFLFASILVIRMDGYSED